MYGNHPNSRISKSEIQRRHRASNGDWRTRDGQVHKVTVRRVA